MSDKLVYSTSNGTLREKEKKKDDFIKADGPCKMRLESNNRGGRDVTVLFNLPFEKSEAKSLMKELQSLLGCGGTFKNGTIEFRGDRRDKVEEYFFSKKIPLVRAGGR